MWRQQFFQLLIFLSMLGLSFCCSEGWINATASISDGYKYQYCFQLFTETETWTSAQRNCRTLGGNLASLFLSEKQEFFEYAFENEANATQLWFIGFYDFDRNGKWKWVDGSLDEYKNWADNVTMTSATTACAVVRPSNSFKWETSDCEALHPYVCEIRQDVEKCLSVVSTGLEFTNDEMNIQLCIELCRGAGKQYAAVHNNLCNCFSSLEMSYNNQGVANVIISATTEASTTELSTSTMSTTTPSTIDPAFNKGAGAILGRKKREASCISFCDEPLISCAQSCPGDSRQMCGGTEEHFSMFIINASLPAESCEELFMQGVRQRGRYLIRTVDGTEGRECFAEITPNVTNKVVLASEHIAVLIVVGVIALVVAVAVSVWKYKLRKRQAVKPKNGPKPEANQNETDGSTEE